VLAATAVSTTASAVASAATAVSSAVLNSHPPETGEYVPAGQSEQAVEPGAGRTKQGAQ
jgi:hypothetical protein